MWLEHLAAGAPAVAAYDFPYDSGQLDHRPLLAAVVADRLRGRDPREIARAFHAALADAVVRVHRAVDARAPLVASGGVFQNRLLLELLHDRLGESLWCNRLVPANDGGLCLGQAALAVFARQLARVH
jgi:hydrogenase maturation protein HypF